MGPEAKPECSPKNNLHNKVRFEFIKNNIIPASPDSPANDDNPNPDQTSHPLILIAKPSTKYMVNRSWFVKLVAKKIILQIVLVKGQSMNKCWMVLFILQHIHF
jgi:hypothetical protein